MRNSNDGEPANALTIRKCRLEAGELKISDAGLLDISMVPSNTDDLVFIDGVSTSWLVDSSNSKIGNGRWLIGIDGALDVFDVIRLPGQRLGYQISLLSLNVIFQISHHQVRLFLLWKSMFKEQ